MKLYVKGNKFSNRKIDDSWEERDDEIVKTPVGLRTKSYTQTQGYQQEIAKYNKWQQIKAIKNKLSKTDYKAIKYAEGQISEEDYARTKAQRQAWRDEINELEKEVS